MLYREIMAVCSEISSTNINAHVEGLSAKPAGARHKRCGCLSVSPDHPLMRQLHDKCSGQWPVAQYGRSKCSFYCQNVFCSQTNSWHIQHIYIGYSLSMFRRSTAIIRAFPPKGMSYTYNRFVCASSWVLSTVCIKL